MANTNFDTNNALTVKLWARIAHTDAVKSTLYGKLKGSSTTSIVQVRDDLKDRGDRIRFPIRMLSQDLGVEEDETLEGKEEGLEYRYFDVTLGEKRKSTQAEMNLSEQRPMFNVRSHIKEQISEWLEEYIDTTFMEYLTGRGQGPGGLPKYHQKTGSLGGNTLNAFSADRIVYGGTATSLGTIVTGSTMSARVIDKLVERAKLANPTMRKASINGRRAWVLILHPWQISALRTDPATAGWFDLNKSMAQGGQSSAIMEETLAVYRDVMILESTRVPTFLAGASSDVPAAAGVFLGAQAAVVAYGRGTDDKGVLRMVEKLKDYDKFLGVGATLIWGMQRTRFSDQSDYAAFQVVTAAAPIA